MEVSNRIIKFRAWNTKDKKMYHIDDKHLLILVNKNGWSFGESSWDWEIENETDETDGILMQYTGLTDADGKEIYEGDIVVEGYKGKYGTYEVKWNKIGFNLGSEDGRDYEVIGNIYEDSHLLERENK